MGGASASASGSGDGCTLGGSSGFRFDDPELDAGTGGLAELPSEGCGDGVLQDGEVCDDGNGRSGDGCASDCTSLDRDYACPLPSNPCVSPVRCGDVAITGSELYDDGNALRGDGCSASCAVELSWPCPVASPRCDAKPCSLNGLGGDGILGVLDTALGTDGRPVYACPGGDCAQNPGHLYPKGSRPHFNGAEKFSDGSDSSSPHNREVPSQLSPAFDADSGTCVFDATSNFYPLDEKGCVEVGEGSVASGGCPHSVSFTSETHFWLEYQGRERFNFSRDDDFWVFVNGLLVLDSAGCT